MDHSISNQQPTSNLSENTTLKGTQRPDHTDLPLNQRFQRLHQEHTVEGRERRKRERAQKILEKTEKSICLQGNHSDPFIGQVITIGLGQRSVVQSGTRVQMVGRGLGPFLFELSGNGSNTINGLGPASSSPNGSLIHHSPINLPLDANDQRLKSYSVSILLDHQPQAFIPAKPQRLPSINS